MRRQTPEEADWRVLAWCVCVCVCRLLTGRRVFVGCLWGRLCVQAGPQPGCAPEPRAVWGPARPDTRTRPAAPARRVVCSRPCCKPSPVPCHICVCCGNVFSLALTGVGVVWCVSCGYCIFFGGGGCAGPVVMAGRCCAAELRETADDLGKFVGNMSNALLVLAGETATLTCVCGLDERPPHI